MIDKLTLAALVIAACSAAFTALFFLARTLLHSEDAPAVKQPAPLVSLADAYLEITAEQPVYPPIVDELDPRWDWKAYAAAHEDDAELVNA